MPLLSLWELFKALYKAPCETHRKKELCAISSGSDGWVGASLLIFFLKRRAPGFGVGRVCASTPVQRGHHMGPGLPHTQPKFLLREGGAGPGPASGCASLQS